MKFSPQLFGVVIACAGIATLIPSLAARPAVSEIANPVFAGSRSAPPGIRISDPPSPAIASQSEPALRRESAGNAPRRRRHHRRRPGRHRRRTVHAAHEANRSAALSVNHATAAQFAALPGLNPVLAGRIVAVRAAGGGFDGPEDLLDVEGMTPRLMDGVFPYLRR